VIQQTALLGTSIFPYVMGMIFYKWKLVSITRNIIRNIPYFIRLIGAVAACVCCIVVHGIVQSLFIAPFLSVVTIICVAVLSDGTVKGRLAKFLHFMGEHSLNIWLVHMFFYFVIFKDFIWIFQYPIVIYIAMLAICIGVSCVIRQVVVFLNNVG
jgi:fucose 4-O-acetylase-like acetyltransferase